MNRTEQKKEDQAPVVSPLANEKTYGERKYTQIFDWGLNYWGNLLASAGFSQWIEHGSRPIKMLGDIAPRDIQKKFGEVIERTFLNGMRGRLTASEGASVANAAVTRRGMAVARSLTLLTPGHFIMIPSVWLGAKFKPQIVEWFNKRHYGEDAMDDPSIKARHQAIEAEPRPTFLGTFTARIMGAIAVNFLSLTVGSDKNFVQTKLGVKNFTGVDPFTENLGDRLGGAMPESARNAANKLAQRAGLDWSNTQRAKGASGPYTNAFQDFGRFTVADTVWTAVTALLIRPFVKLIRFIPGMSYKPKVVANSPTFDGEKVKVPANRYAYTIPLDEQPQPEPAALSKAAADEKPNHTVNHISQHKTIAANNAQQLAHA